MKSKILILFALFCLTSVFCLKQRLKTNQNDQENIPDMGPTPSNSTDTPIVDSTSKSQNTDPSSFLQSSQAASAQQTGTTSSGLVYISNLHHYTSFAVHHGAIIDGMSFYQSSGLHHVGGRGGSRSPFWLAAGDCITQLSYKIGTHGGTTRLLELIVRTKHGHNYGPYGNGDSGRPWVTTGTAGQCATEVAGYVSNNLVNNLFIPRGLKTLSGTYSLKNNHWKKYYSSGNQLTSHINHGFNLQYSSAKAYFVETADGNTNYLRMAPWENPGVNIASAPWTWELWYVENINGKDCLRNAYHGFYFGVNSNGHGFAQYDCWSWESWTLSKMY